jgi:hypothetical protein
MNPTCKVCQSTTVEHAKTVVREKYDARLMRCPNCGFIFVENPTWLGEAYAEPINRSDTGYVWRNLWARDRMRACIEARLNPHGTFLDYAAGYGMFVRLMRDAGYDFRWSDLYCQNLFSRGFEAPNPPVGPYEAVTAFEVFEHLVDPVGELEKLSSLAACLIFSTKLLPEPAPQPSEWWYYGLDHGQHIAFYTRKSLELLAARFGFHYALDDSEPHTDLHVFSRQEVPPAFFPPYPPPLAPRWKIWKRNRGLPTRPRLPG